jgi:hypothetical protein
MGEKMRFIGEFVDGRPHGEGEEIYEDGSYYKGTFQNGVK